MGRERRFSLSSVPPHTHRETPPMVPGYSVLLLLLTPPTRGHVPRNLFPSTHVHQRPGTPLHKLLSDLEIEQWHQTHPENKVVVRDFTELSQTSAQEQVHNTETCLSTCTCTRDLCRMSSSNPQPKTARDSLLVT